MSNMQTNFLKYLHDVGKVLIKGAKSYGEVTVVHHDDADGLVSAAILKFLLNKLNIDSHLICLEKTYPQIISKLESSHGLLIYADLAAPHARMISNLNRKRDLIIIIDHHDPEKVDDPKIINVNPEFFNISGEREASASTVTYLLVRSVLGSVPLLAKLAVIGATEIPGEPISLNKIVIDEALRLGVVKVAKKKRIDYYILEDNHLIPRSEYSKKLTILGSVGYYRKGPQLAIKACLEGFSKDLEVLYKEFEKERRSLYKKALSQIRSRNISYSKNILWFHVKNLFINVGSKVLGTFTSYLVYRMFMNSSRYVIGFMYLNPEIPGFGKLDGDYSKVSLRTTPRLANLIRHKLRPSSSELLYNHCKALGGFGDGHEYAASGILPRGKEETLIERIESDIHLFISKKLRHKKKSEGLDKYL